MSQRSIAKLYGCPLAKPQIPANVLQRLKDDETLPYNDSIVFTEDFNLYRHTIAAMQLTPDCDVPTSFTRERISRFELTQSQRNTTMSWLHLAVCTADLPLAYEMIRLGTSVSAKDSLGRSPLYLGCYLLSLLTRRRRSVIPIHGLNQATSRISSICVLLVEQHSDVDEVHDKSTLLYLACASRSWDLIQVLLAHGANTTPPELPRDKYPIAAFEMGDDKERYTSLISVTSFESRPPRHCPCWSGKNLDDCHGDGTTRPFPEEFLCRCGSRKIYAKCCKKRGLKRTEQWYDEGSYIRPSVEFSLGMPKDISSESASKTEWIQLLEKHQARMEIPRTEAWHRTQKAIVLAELNSTGQIDPAFAYPAERLEFMPNPIDSMISRTGRHEGVQEWNALVDEYIASGVDKRDPVEIENIAKIGLAGGPLHRRCESPGCDNLEGRNNVKMLVCAGCQTTVFCSRDCQKRAWKFGGHKAACKSRYPLAQTLPSQANFQRAYAESLETP